MNDIIVVLITSADKAEAERIAGHLVEGKLAACVNIVPAITSIFHWQGKLETDSEALLIVKSTSARLPEITNAVKQLHSYEVPEIIALPVTGGNDDYLDWLTETVT